MKKDAHAKLGLIWKMYQFFDEETLNKEVLQFTIASSTTEFQFGKTFELLHKLKNFDMFNELKNLDNILSS